MRQKDRKDLPIALGNRLKGLECKYDGRAHDHKVAEETLINRIGLFVEDLWLYTMPDKGKVKTANWWQALSKTHVFVTLQWRSKDPKNLA